MRKFVKTVCLRVRAGIPLWGFLFFFAQSLCEGEWRRGECDITELVPTRWCFLPSSLTFPFLFSLLLQGLGHMYYHFCLNSAYISKTWHIMCPAVRSRAGSMHWSSTQTCTHTIMHIICCLLCGLCECIYNDWLSSADRSVLHSTPQGGQGSGSDNAV